MLIIIFNKKIMTNLKFHYEGVVKIYQHNQEALPKEKI